jgi:hypothetical protein
VNCAGWHGALAGSLAVSTWAQASPRPAAAHGSTAKFLGVWNYQTPEPKSGLNIAAVSGTGFSEDYPQVGWIDFTQDPDGEVTGTTDQGCTWQFDLESGELQLASPRQTCFNKVIDSRYQMHRWTVSVTGNREREYIQATSFLLSGTFNFTLRQGARTKVRRNSRLSLAKNYAGDWTFIPAKSATGVNMEQSSRPAGRHPGRLCGAPRPSQEPARTASLCGPRTAVSGS